jgi:threonyl-tRNA synthetase
MIHRAIFGSLERFFGILIENFAGAFPTWMMPEQVSIIPVSEKFNDQADEFAKKFDLQGIRVSVNKSNTTVNYRVREEQLRKVPYMIVFGEKEASGQPLNIRTRNGNTAENVNLDDFIKTVKEEISERKLTLSY